MDKLIFRFADSRRHVKSGSLFSSMGKKHEKKSRRPSDLSSEQLEKQARDHMAAARFRHARDTYKILCKQDRERFLPGLIEANSRLAEEMMQNGMISEAEAVLTYLKTIAPSLSIAAIEISFALKRNDWQSAWDAAVLIRKDAATVHGERHKATVADALVLAFPGVEEIGDLNAPDASELAAIVSALRCVSEERWEQAQELLRPIPRGSLFAAWKILVKGMIAFYMSDLKKAETLFGQLPPHGATAGAAHAFRVFLGSGYWQNFKEPRTGRVLESACRLLSFTDLAPALTRADQSWRAARHTDSYKEIRQAPGFPSELPDLCGALSDFYFKAPFAMPDAPHDKYIGWFDRLAASGQFKSDLEARLTYRLLGCAEFDNPYSEEIEDFWRMFLQYYPKNDPLRSKVESLSLERIGAYFGEREEANPFSFGEEKGVQSRDPESAVRLLKESIECDSSNLDAYLKLLDVYEWAKRDNDRDRLLDRMTESFPKDKAVLLRAGRESLNRNACVKAIQYLERAHLLDALDPGVSDILASAYVRLGRQQYLKHNINKGRNTFDRVRRHATTDRTDFTRGLDYLQGLQGILELTFGDTGMGLRLVKAARESTQSPVALEFFLHGISRLYKSNPGRTFWAELRKSQPQVISARVRKEVFLMFEYLRSLKEDLDWTAESKFVRDCLAPLGSKAFSREEVIFYIPKFGPYPEFHSLGENLIAEGLRRDPTDPRFRLYSEMGDLRSPLDLDLAKVEIIYRDATRQGDKETAGIAKTLIQVVENFDESPFEDDEDFGLPRDQIEDMRRLAIEMSDAEFEAFRQESRKFIPLPLFDLIMGGKRNKSSRRSPSELERNAQRRTDPPDLFNE
jgi:tetratricopeptide (TPR) repeat protein